MAENNWEYLDITHIYDKEILNVYSVHLSEFIQYQSEIETYLNENELFKYRNSYRNRSQYLITRGLLKLLASKYINSDPKKIIIEEGVNKKPFIAGNKELHFNISHSDDLVMLSFFNSQTGIDVEKINYSFGKEDVMSISFTENEIEYINNGENTQLAFYKLWTRKESLAKALSKGIDDDFKYLPSLTGRHPIDLKIIKSDDCMTTSTFRYGIDYVGAISYKSSNPIEIQLLKLDKNNIFN